MEPIIKLEIVNPIAAPAHRLWTVYVNGVQAMAPASRSMAESFEAGMRYALRMGKEG